MARVLEIRTTQSQHPQQAFSAEERQKFRYSRHIHFTHLEILGTNSDEPVTETIALQTQPLELRLQQSRLSGQLANLVG